MEKLFSLKNGARLLIAFGCLSLGLAGCAEKTRLLQQNSNLSFNQDFSPPLLDILWVLDDRSQFWNTPGKTKIIEEAKQFFTRLDSATTSYQMGFITGDMHIAQGRLQPLNSPIVLKKNMGTLGERVAFFSSLLTQVAFNSHTGGLNQSFETTTIALSNGFKPRANVPLVLVFLSDADDHSTVPTSQSAVEYYANKFLAFKGNNPNLLRVYSINYERLTSAQVVDSNTRCITLYNAEVDSLIPNFFQDRFFQLAHRLTGETSNVCGSFSQSISLNGLRVSELSKRFKIEVPIQESTLRVTVSLNGQVLSSINWTYEVATNEVVFTEPPPEGSRIDINFLAK
ncbi:MAG: hypothetical protein EXR74_04475 [Bdellovibrionales bacterium]|nr:hypothetical protein [Bdellovibrionales bacterium]